jgi:hypothetical protein
MTVAKLQLSKKLNSSIGVSIAEYSYVLHTRSNEQLIIIPFT